MSKAKTACTGTLVSSLSKRSTTPLEQKPTAVQRTIITARALWPLQGPRAAVASRVPGVSWAPLNSMCYTSVSDALFLVSSH